MNKKTSRNKWENKKRKALLYLFIFTTLTALILITKELRNVINYQKDSIFSLFDSPQKHPSVPMQTTDFVDLTHLYSPYSILIDLSDNQTLAQNNSQSKIYPASLTKIMTAIIAIENIDNLNETLLLTQKHFESLYERDASMAGFEIGEKVTMRDLLYGTLLPSGAECCLALSDRVSGSESKFVNLMNSKAKELGMNNTLFCNSTGLHNVNHYSTVEDIAKLLQYALKNKEFRSIFTSKQYSMSATNLHPDGLTLYSTMFSSLNDTNVVGGKILGGKTGFTDEGGLCLASLAQIDGKEYIFVSAKAKGDHQTQPYHILDANNVYNQVGSINRLNDSNLK